MKKLKSKFLISAGAIAGITMPLMAFAQAVQDNCVGQNPGTINFILCKIAFFISSIIPILITLGVIYFIYGVITYAIAKDEEAKTRGRDVMIYGLIALLVIVSIWGLVAILQNTFGIQGSAKINIPCIETQGVKCPT